MLALIYVRLIKIVSLNFFHFGFPKLPLEKFYSRSQVSDCVKRFQRFEVVNSKTVLNAGRVILPGF